MRALALGLTALMGCQGPCPSKSWPDPVRAEVLKGLALTNTEARICFVSGSGGGVDEDGVVRLDASLADPDAAARLVHLLRHLEQPTPEPGPSCLEGWLRREAEAWELELQTRLRLGLPVRLPFEAAWRVMRDRGVVLAWLREHPDGGGGVEPLGAAYVQRCGPG